MAADDNRSAHLYHEPGQPSDLVVLPTNHDVGGIVQSLERADDDCCAAYGAG